MTCCRIGLLLLSYLLVATTTALADFSQSFATLPGSRVRAKVSAPFDKVPASGMFPLRLEISNDSGSAMSFVLSGRSGYPGSGSQQMVMNHTIEVPAHSVRGREFYFPVVGSSYYSSLQLTLDGPEMVGGNVQVGSDSPDGKTLLPFSALSNGCATGLEEVRLKAKEVGHAFAGSSFSPSLLPSDWRGLSGVRTLWIRAEEWPELSSEQRNAIKDWLFQGGILYFLRPATGTSQLSDLPEDEKYGFGKVVVVVNHGERIDPYRLIAGIRLTLGKGATALQRTFQLEQSGYYGSGASSAFALEQGLLSLNDGVSVVIILMAIYAILVGPINILFFARGEGRHRLYWTTPLLASGATVCLMLCIVLKDGLGADGNRSALVAVNPVENRQFVVQEQAYRSGLLLSKSFSLPSEIVLLPARDGYGDNSSRAKQFLRQGLQYVRSDDTTDGDWFGNRRVQRHQLSWFESSRGRLEVLPSEGKQLRVRSTFKGTIDELFVVDAEGQWWTATEIPAGQTRTFAQFEYTRSSLRQPFERFQARARRELGPSGSALLEEMSESKGTFIARVKGADSVMRETLPTVRWNSEAVYVTGPLVRTGG